MKHERVVPIRPTEERTTLERSPGMVLEVFGQRFRIESSVRITEMPPRRVGGIVPIKRSAEDSD